MLRAGRPLKAQLTLSATWRRLSPVTVSNYFSKIPSELRFQTTKLFKRKRI
jgi:hypothetical protein